MVEDIEAEEPFVPLQHPNRTDYYFAYLSPCNTGHELDIIGDHRYTPLPQSLITFSPQLSSSWTLTCLKWASWIRHIEPGSIEIEAPGLPDNTHV